MNNDKDTTQDPYGKAQREAEAYRDEKPVKKYSPWVTWGVFLVIAVAAIAGASWLDMQSSGRGTIVNALGTACAVCWLMVRLRKAKEARGEDTKAKK